MNDLPEWLQEWIKRGIKALGLAEYEIDFKLVGEIDDDKYIEGQCHQAPHINAAKVLFRSDIADTRTWRITVLHELIHVKHSRIDRFLEKAVFPECGIYTKDVCATGYREVNEAFTHSLATNLYDVMMSNA